MELCVLQPCPAAWCGGKLLAHSICRPICRRLRCPFQRRLQSTCLFASSLLTRPSSAADDTTAGRSYILPSLRHRVCLSCCVARRCCQLLRIQGEETMGHD